MHVAVLGIKQLPARAGADRVVERLLEHDSGRHEYTVYLMRGEWAPLVCTRGRHYVYVPAIGGKHFRALSYFVLCCAHVLVKGRYDVAHVHNSDFGVVAPLLRLKRGVRIVGTFHGNPYERAKWGSFARAVLRLGEYLFVRTSHVLTSVAISKRVSGRTVHYIPNGVDRWEPSAVPVDYGDLGVEPGTYVLFVCGRLDRTKGLQHLVEAYRGLPEAGPLLVIGDFTHDRAHAREVEEAAAADARIVLRRELLDREALLDVFHNAAVFVFPSEVEAMSMVLLEAIAAGCLVVCSDIPENVAVVGADYPFLFRSGDPASLGDVLRRALVADRAVAAPVRERLTAEFSWDRIAGEYERLYELRSLTGS